MILKYLDYPYLSYKTKKNFMTRVQPAHIESASPSWTLLMQSGVLVDCRVNQSLGRLLREDFGLSEELLNDVEAIILNGEPVDDPNLTPVAAHSRLALAAGLPGVAGMAVKKNSPLKALRNSITSRGDELDLPHVAGRIVLALYSLTIKRLGPFFLKRGVWVTGKQLTFYGRFALDDIVNLGYITLKVEEWLKELEREPGQLYYLTATLASLANENEFKLSTNKEPKAKDDCADCPVGCIDQKKKGWHRHAAELAELWGLAPQDEQLQALSEEYRYICDDMGLEAFEISGAVSLAQKGTSTPKTVEGVRTLLDHLRQETLLGRLMAMGRETTAKFFDLKNLVSLGLQKQSPYPPEDTALLDTLGLCERAASRFLNNPEALTAAGQIFEASYGITFEPQTLAQIGALVLSLEQDFDQKTGR
jgi:hypothetical protein